MPVAAFCPYPPLLVDGVTGGDVAEVEALRSACRAAVVELVAGQVAEMTVVGPDPGVAASDVSRTWATGAAGTLAGLGAPVPDITGSPDEMLPLSLTVGRWLLEDGGFAGEAVQIGLAELAPPQACHALGRSLRGRSLLVLGDGSFRRGDKPPGGPHPDAADHDARVATALAAGDVAALAGLDPADSAEVGATGRAAWQVLAGWASAHGRVSSVLHYDDAPFGVGYLVGTWTTS